MQQAAPEKPMQQSAQAPQPAQPTPQQSAAQNAVANMKRDAFIGKYLYDKSGNSVAEIQDVKTSPDGKIQAAELDVGGFLGIGSRRVSVPVDKLQMKGTGSKSTMTSEQIRDLPARSPISRSLDYSRAGLLPGPAHFAECVGDALNPQADKLLAGR